MLASGPAEPSVLLTIATGICGFTALVVARRLFRAGPKAGLEGGTALWCVEQAQERAASEPSLPLSLRGTCCVQRHNSSLTAPPERQGDNRNFNSCSHLSD